MHRQRTGTGRRDLQVLTTARTRTSSPPQSQWTERLDPESAAPANTGPDSTHRQRIFLDLITNKLSIHRLVKRLLHLLLAAPLKQEHLWSDVRGILPPTATNQKSLHLDTGLDFFS